ncbi:putative protein 2 [Montipora capricornis]|uniref:putative protein 2 n=1 Tax=Montipora foliosa TaxID=591990 RepID=UPI0035F216EF
MLSLNFCCIVVFSSLALLVTLTEAQYDDVRCKCVCPKESNKTAKIPNVFVRTVEPKDCTCEHIVQREEQFCLRCQCMYENRNTTLIKVVIIFILVIIAILCFYLIFLVIDSKRKPLELSITADEQQERLRSRSIRNFDQKMAKWKRTVTEQRRTIYDTRTMLN